MRQSIDNLVNTKSSGHIFRGPYQLTKESEIPRYNLGPGPEQASAHHHVLVSSSPNYRGKAVHLQAKGMKRLVKQFGRPAAQSNNRLLRLMQKLEFSCFNQKRIKSDPGEFSERLT